jgi:hypothetical protein
MITLCQFGNMSDEVTRYNTKIMAERVLPQIRGLFDDQWEDHWWIKPLAKAGVSAGLGARTLVGAEG